MKSGSGEPTDLTINHLAGNTENISVNQSASLSFKYSLACLLKKYKASIEDNNVIKSIEYGLPKIFENESINIGNSGKCAE